MIYNLPQIVIDDATPPWARSVIASMQADEDIRYEKAVDAFYSAGQQWIDTNMLNRSLQPNPLSYSPTQFTTPIPTRTEITGWDQAEGEYVSHPFTDPNIHPPALPAFVVPAGASTGQMRQTNTGPDPTQSALGAILSDLAKIKAAMKIS